MKTQGNWENEEAVVKTYELVRGMHGWPDESDYKNIIQSQTLERLDKERKVQVDLSPDWAWVLTVRLGRKVGIGDLDRIEAELIAAGWDANTMHLEGCTLYADKEDENL